MGRGKVETQLRRVPDYGPLYKSIVAIYLWRPQKIEFFLPHASTWARPPLPLWTSTCGRHEIHIALLKWRAQWPSGLKAEIRLYDCNLFKTVLLLIFITNRYRGKFPLFIPSKDEILVKTVANFFAWEEDRMKSVDSNFNFLCGRPHWA